MLRFPFHLLELITVIIKGGPKVSQLVSNMKHKIVVKIPLSFIELTEIFRNEVLHVQSTAHDVQLFYKLIVKFRCYHSR
jgi:hypothetical protein